MTGAGSGANKAAIKTQQGAFGGRRDDTRNQDAREKFFFPRSEIQAAPDSYQMTGITDNIDERDINNPLCTTSYVNDMYLYYREKEVETSVRPIYMENQSDLNERMRSILVDWLVEVHLNFKCLPETLYLAINTLDRFLQKKNVLRSQLQLVGVTSLLIASKYEQIYPPELGDLVYICDKAYTEQDVRLCLCVDLSVSLACLCACLSYDSIEQAVLTPPFWFYRFLTWRSPS